jgi:hypothetical protein
VIISGVGLEGVVCGLMWLRIGAGRSYSTYKCGNARCTFGSLYGGEFCQYLSITFASRVELCSMETADKNPSDVSFRYE